MDLGACVGTDYKVFFPDATNTDAIETAKAICRVCEVRRDCLEFAINNFEEGIWGATTPEERKFIRRHRR